MTAAEALASLGWRVIPIAPGFKYPKISKWQRVATDDLETIQQWYTGKYNEHGVGVATGAGSGVWVLDVDMHDADGLQALDDLEEEHGTIPQTVTAHTGGGGAHLFFKWDDDRPVTNGMATGLPAGLDVRGEGGQVVVAPTIHPDGEPYEWASDPWEYEVNDAPEWLYDLLFDDGEVPGADEPSDELANVIELPSSRRPRSPVADDSAADWLTSENDWHSTLIRDGWSRHSDRGNQTWWTRPGKAIKDGHSAVLHEDTGVFVIFTTALPGLPDFERAGSSTADGLGVSVNMFGYLAATRYGGDRSKAASEARTEMQALNGGAQRVNHPTARLGSETKEDDSEPQVSNDIPVGPVELGEWWDGTAEVKEPDLLMRTDGVGLLYADQLNWIHGDSGSGKTWVALIAVAQALLAGLKVCWVHYEDPTPNTLVGRLRALGLDRRLVLEGFTYWDPQGAEFDPWALIEYCSDNDVATVVLDSIGEAFNASGINENEDSEVGPWITNGPRALVNAGVGFIGIDHGTKAGEHKLHPSGSKRKRASLTGAGLLVEAVNAPTQTADGMLRLTCAKDRHGTHQQATTVGLAHLRHNVIGGLVGTIEKPVDHMATTETEAADKLTGAVVRMVADNPGIKKSSLLPLMPTAATTKKLAAIDAAIERGDIRQEPGTRKSVLLYSAKDER